ncbi:GlxA family transcriptional regulator [Nitrincola sp. MINF-07-Sa-05]|uniref:GlxA family transcriptional regulator n=1 Tax=Nitrincola salilacus TaxID=3400273 RepID=UPI003917DC55
MTTFSAKSDFQKKHLIVLLAYPNVNLLDIAGPAQVFSSALITDEVSLPYEVIVASPDGGLVLTDTGISLDTFRLDEELCKKANTILIAGGRGIYSLLNNENLINLLKRFITPCRRIGSICMGAFLLAATGCLHQKRVATHWEHCVELQLRYPDIKVESSPIYINDHGLWTSAGVTAGIDLALAIVQEDHNRAIALSVARDLVVYLKRPGGQNQFSSTLHLQCSDSSGRFDALHSWIIDNLDKDLSINTLADFMAMSPRNFAREYKKLTEVTPQKAVETLRIESARLLLETTCMKIKSISKRCGFENEERLRRAFTRRLGINPTLYRERFGLDS